MSAGHITKFHPMHGRKGTQPTYVGPDGTNGGHLPLAEARAWSLAKLAEREAAVEELREKQDEADRRLRAAQGELGRIAQQLTEAEAALQSARKDVGFRVGLFNGSASGEQP